MTTYFTIYGKRQLCRILVIRPFGTYDVQCANGKCFRVSGLS